MRNSHFHSKWPLLSLSTIVILLSSCRDSSIPTEIENPGATRVLRSEACEGSAEGGYICPGISGGGGGEGGGPAEDPGNCNINTGQNCDNFPGTGGGGDGGSSGGGGSPVEAPASTNGDLPLDLQQLNCVNPGSAQERAFCVRDAVQPGTVRYQRTLDAIDRIRNRGGICRDIADTALAYLVADQVGYFVAGSGMQGGYGVSAHGLALQDRWVDEFYNRTDATGRNLDWIIVHETEHARGQLAHSYTGVNGVSHTQNDNLCSGR